MPSKTCVYVNIAHIVDQILAPSHYRAQGCAMDSLKFACSWRGGVTGAKLPVKLGGLQLEGCTFDGSHLSETQSDSPIVSAIPPCVIAWIPKVG